MRIPLVAKCAVVCATACTLLASASAQDRLSLNITSAEGYTVHIMPTPALKQEMDAVKPPAGALTYHGGPVMSGMTTYAIYWNGNGKGYSAKYQSVTNRFLADYPAHGIENNSTQYYSGTSNYIHNIGGFGGSYVDTSAFPTGGCTDPVTGSNCVTDAQIQAEVTKVMGIKGWTAGLNKMFLVFTSEGEGSCSGNSCAYSAYCAYHGYFGSTPTIYANMPYADPTYCYASGTQQDPNGDIPADANVNVASHEMTEANTDPELNAWWDPNNGEEIGDLCAWTFGSQSWDGGLANQMWNGHFYDLQLEYDNHTASCVQVGP